MSTVTFRAGHSVSAGSEADYIRRVQTPIVQDMRRTARELGIVRLLMEHQRIVLQRPAEAWDLVEDVLIRLGVSNAELLTNLEGPKDV